MSKAKKRKVLANLASGFLAVSMMFGTISLPAIAEETAEPTSEPSGIPESIGGDADPNVQAQASPEETAAPETAAPEEETPEAAQEASAEPTAATEETAEPSEEPAETAEAAAESSAEPSASAAPCETCTAEAGKIPEDVTERAEEEAIKQVQEEKEQDPEAQKPEKEITEAAEAPEWNAETDNDMDLYVAADAADYVAALATLTDSPSKRLIVMTDQKISDVLDSGKAVYYNGIYILTFDTDDEARSAKELLTAAYGEENVIQDSTITVQELGDDGTETTDEGQEGTDAGQAETDEGNTDIGVVENGSGTIAYDIDELNRQAASEGLSVHEETDRDADVKLVAVIDTGANEGADVQVNLTDDPMEDVNGHGTAVVKTIKTNAPNARIISIKAISDKGYGSLASAAQAVRYAIEANVDIINISAVARDYGQAEEFKAAIREALDKGIIVVVAAGNYHSDVKNYVPANIEGVDTIGAARQVGGVSINAFAAQYFSDYGDGVDYWYIADSTSDAAAQETGILAAGLENLGWDATNTWYRFTKVVYQNGEGNSADAEEKEYNAISGCTAYSNDGLTIQGSCLNPGGGGNISAQRIGPMVNGIYPNTVFHDKYGNVLFCMDSSKLANYCAQYSEVTTTTRTSETKYFTYPDQNYTGHVYRHSIQLDALPDKYIPGKTYILQNHGDANLNSDGYFVKSVTAKNGNVNAVHVTINGDNTVSFLVDEAEADMPDGISVEFDTNKQINGTCTVVYETTTTILKGWDFASAQPFELGTPTVKDSKTVEKSRDCTDTHLYSGQTVGTNSFRGGFTFDKDDFDHAETAEAGAGTDGNAAGDGTLEGAEFTVYNTRNNAAVEVITTAADGTPKSIISHADGYGEALDASNLKYGDYLVKETKAPYGYLLNEEWSYSFSIRSKDGMIADASRGTVTWTDSDGDGFLDEWSQGSEDVTYNNTDGNGGRVLDTGIRGGFEITKYDTDRFADGTKRYTSSPSGTDPYNTPQGNAKLDKAVYEVRNASDMSINADGTAGDGNGSSDGKVYVFNENLSGVEYAKDADAKGGAWYETGDLIMTVTTDENGHWASGKNTLPYGTYTITEKEAPEGYNLNAGWSVTFRIREQDKIFNVIDLADVPMTNSADADSIKAKAEDGSRTNHDYVYDKAENGVVTADFMMDDVIRGGVKFRKADLERDASVPQGDATLEGTHIAIVNDSEQDVMVNGHFYEPGKIVYELITDATGECETAADLLPYGHYYAIETQAPVGYLVNTDWKVEFDIAEDGKVLDYSESDTLKNQVIRGDVRIYKYDLESDRSEAIGSKDHATRGNDLIEINDQGQIAVGEDYFGAALNDIWFEIKNVSPESVLVPEGGGFREVRPDEVVTYISSSWNDEVGQYTAETKNRYLPYGTYTIRELTLYECSEIANSDNPLNMEDNFPKMDEEELKDSANNSYRMTDGTVRTFQIGSHSYGPVTINTPVTEVDGLITDTGATGTLSYVQDDSDSCSASQSEYEAFNPETGALISTDNLEDVVYDASTGKSSVKTLSFHKDAETQTADIVSPMSDLVEKDGTVLKKTGNAASDSIMIFKNQVERNDFSFFKKNGNTNNAMESMWVLENVNTGERHVLYTNTKGAFDTTGAANTYKTNANDKFLELIDKGIPIDLANKADNYGAGSVVVKNGIWFSETEDGTYSDPDDSLGSLPYGVYTLSEAATTKITSGLEKNIIIVISQDSRIAGKYTHSDINDWPIHPESEALNYQLTEAGSHNGKADGTSAVIRDTVSFEGIENKDFGEDYVLVGKLWNKTKSEFVKDADGNDLVSVKDAAVDAEKVEYSNEFTIADTSAVGGCDIVVYEYLYKKDVWESINSGTIPEQGDDR